MGMRHQEGLGVFLVSLAALDIRKIRKFEQQQQQQQQQQQPVGAEVTARHEKVSLV